MHRQDRAKAALPLDPTDRLAGLEQRYRRFRRGDVDIERFRLAVHQHWRGAAINDDLGRSGKRQRGHQYEVAGADAGGFEGEVKRSGARVDGQRVTHADEARELGLESLAFASRRQPTGAKNRAHRRHFLLADVGAMKWNAVTHDTLVDGPVFGTAREMTEGQPARTFPRGIMRRSAVPGTRRPLVCRLAPRV